MGKRILATAIFGRLLGCVLVIAVFSTNCFNSFAGLVISPTGGTVVFAGATDASDMMVEDGVFPLLTNGSFSGSSGVGFTGKFYGSSVADLWIAENGNLNAAEDGGFSSRSLKQNSTLRISPFGDDFVIAPDSGASIINHSLNGSYLAVTWKDAWLYNDSGSTTDMSRTTQVIWFEREMTIRGFTFMKDDIAFGYSGATGGNIAATIGVGRNGQSLAYIPGDVDEDGLVYSGDSERPEQGDLIPWGDNEFLLFRPSTDSNGAPSYSASRENFTAVPEPSSIGVAIAWMCLVIAKWRRKIFSVVVGQRCS